MYYRRLNVASLALAVIVLGCGSGGGADTATDGPTPQRSGRNRLTQAEMLETTATTVYEAVQQLRPTWFTPRGTDPSSGDPLIPVVYVDGVRAGDLEFLRQLRIEEVERLRYINARDATTRWGTGVPGGVIEVSRARG